MDSRLNIYSIPTLLVPLISQEAMGSDARAPIIKIIKDELTAIGERNPQVVISFINEIYQALRKYQNSNKEVAQALKTYGEPLNNLEIDDSHSSHRTGGRSINNFLMYLGFVLNEILIYHPKIVSDVFSDVLVKYKNSLSSYEDQDLPTSNFTPIQPPPRTMKMWAPQRTMVNTPYGLIEINVDQIVDQLRNTAVRIQLRRLIAGYCRDAAVFKRDLVEEGGLANDDLLEREGMAVLFHRLMKKALPNEPQIIAIALKCAIKDEGKGPLVDGLQRLGLVHIVTPPPLPAKGNRVSAAIPEVWDPVPFEDIPNLDGPQEIVPFGTIRFHESFARIQPEQLKEFHQLIKTYFTYDAVDFLLRSRGIDITERVPRDEGWPFNLCVRFCTRGIGRQVLFALFFGSPKHEFVNGVEKLGLISRGPRAMQKREKGPYETWLPRCYLSRRNYRRPDLESQLLSDDINRVKSVIINSDRLRFPDLYLICRDDLDMDPNLLVVHDHKGIDSFVGNLVETSYRLGRLEDLLDALRRYDARVFNTFSGNSWKLPKYQNVFQEAPQTAKTRLREAIIYEFSTPAFFSLFLHDHFGGLDIDAISQSGSFGNIVSEVMAYFEAHFQLTHLVKAFVSTITADQRRDDIEDLLGSIPEFCSTNLLKQEKLEAAIRLRTSPAITTENKLREILLRNRNSLYRLPFLPLGNKDWSPSEIHQVAYSLQRRLIEAGLDESVY